MEDRHATKGTGLRSVPFDWLDRPHRDWLSDDWVTKSGAVGRPSYGERLRRYSTVEEVGTFKSAFIGQVRDQDVLVRFPAVYLTAIKI